MARYECATLARFLRASLESNGGERQRAAEFDGVDSNDRALESDGTGDQLDHRQRNFWAAVGGVGARRKDGADRVLGGGYGDGGDRGLPCGGGLAISRDGWAVSVRARDARKILGNSDRVDDLAVAHRGGIGDGKSFYHVPWEGLSASDRACLQICDPERTGGSAGACEFSRGEVRRP